ncbi:Protein of unknown function [Shimia marina]|nr:Protein of unknown function [Shimia marina]
MMRSSPKVLSSGMRLCMISALAGCFILYGLVTSGPAQALQGVWQILTVRDMLMTDYMAVGGVGGAMLNAGLLLCIAAMFYWRTGAAVGGAAVACLFLVLGFGLFGKNLLNIWPILAGVFLHARFKGQPFADHLNTAFFGCALAPVVSEILFSSRLELFIRLPLALTVGTLMGFVMPPIAAQLFKAHEGHNLYNMGFTAGMLGVLVVSLFLSFGFVPEPVFLWETEQTAVLAPFVIGMFASFLLIGLVVEPECIQRLPDLHARSGLAPSDFAAELGDGVVLVNMGLLGLCATGVILGMGSVLNGPTLAAIFSVVGFGAFGKHLWNCAPIVAGVVALSLLKGADLTTPGLILAALFSTSLAPMAGRFGWHWGVMTGMIHASVAQSVGVLHAGLNLYNNGFAAGIVATVLSAVILSLKAEKDEKAG